MTPMQDMWHADCKGQGMSTSWHEDEISERFKDAFDQPKTFEGYVDDLDYDQPYRHITDWFLLHRSRHGFASLHPLPDSMRFTPSYELHGVLEPSRKGHRGGSQLRPIRVVIRELQHWSLDRSSTTRGLWVETNSAWYQLKWPSSEECPLGCDIAANGGGRTMADVHLPMRAKFGLVSNLLDILSEKRDGRPYHYLALHVNRTPRQVYDLLSPTKTQLRKHHALTPEPFDWDLLTRCSSFVLHHLDNFHVSLNSSSVFLKELAEMDKKCRSAKKLKKPWAVGPYPFLNSALDAEKRSGQTPWGDRVPNLEAPRPNELIDIQIEKKLSASDDRGDGAPAIESPEQKRFARGGTTVLSSRMRDRAPSPTTVSLQMAGQETDSDLGGPATEPLVILKEPQSEELTTDALKTAREQIAQFLEDSSSNASSTPGLNKEKANLFVTNVINSSPIESLEVILVSLQGLLHSDEKVFKDLFKPASKPHLAGCRGVFIRWLDRALDVIATRYGSNEDALPDDIRRTEEEIVVTVMDLIVGMSVIKKPKQLQTLKDKYGIDWFRCVERAAACGSTYRIEPISVACRKAQAHLDGIMAKDTVVPAVKKQPANGTRNENEVGGNGSRKRSPDEFAKTQAKRQCTDMKASVGTDNSSDAGKMEKKEKERMRSQRMAELLQKAQSSARAYSASHSEIQGSSGDSAAKKNQNVRNSPERKTASKFGDASRSRDFCDNGGNNMQSNHSYPTSSLPSGTSTSCSFPSSENSGRQNGRNGWGNTNVGRQSLSATESSADSQTTGRTHRSSEPQSSNEKQRSSPGWGSNSKSAGASSSGWGSSSKRAASSSGWAASSTGWGSNSSTGGASSSQRQNDRSGWGSTNVGRQALSATASSSDSQTTSRTPRSSEPQSSNEKRRSSTGWGSNSKSAGVSSSGWGSSSKGAASSSGWAASSRGWGSSATGGGSSSGWGASTKSGSQSGSCWGSSAKGGKNASSSGSNAADGESSSGWGSATRGASFGAKDGGSDWGSSFKSATSNGSRAERGDQVDRKLPGVGVDSKERAAKRVTPSGSPCDQAKPAHIRHGTHAMYSTKPKVEAQPRSHATVFEHPSGGRVLGSGRKETDKRENSARLNEESKKPAGPVHDFDGHRASEMSAKGSSSVPSRDGGAGKTAAPASTGMRSSEDGEISETKEKQAQPKDLSVPPAVHGVTGSGRGRGRDKNMPAWMSQKIDDNRNVGMSSNAKSPQSNEASVRASSGAVASGRLGRGREKNVPAWMTQRITGNNNSVGRSGAEDGSARRQLDGKETDAPSVALQQKRDTKRGNVVDERLGLNGSQAPRAHGPVPGSGRGRGRDKNLPAWVSQKKDEGRRVDMSSNKEGSSTADQKPVVPPSLGAVAGHGHGRGRGRGRGRDINIPAWMSKNIDSNAGNSATVEKVGRHDVPTSVARVDACDSDGRRHVAEMRAQGNDRAATTPSYESSVGPPASDKTSRWVPPGSSAHSSSSVPGQSSQGGSRWHQVPQRRTGWGSDDGYRRSHQAPMESGGGGRGYRGGTGRAR